MIIKSTTTSGRLTNFMSSDSLERREWSGLKQRAEESDALFAGFRRLYIVRRRSHASGIVTTRWWRNRRQGPDLQATIFGCGRCSLLLVFGCPSRKVLPLEECNYRRTRRRSHAFDTTRPFRQFLGNCNSNNDWWNGPIETSAAIGGSREIRHLANTAHIDRCS